MADYHLEGPKPARIYEVILPKKLGYFGKIQEVLEDLFNEQAIRNIPFVQQAMARRHQQEASFDEEDWIKTLCQASRGYSIYEMDGRYLSPQGPVDERVLVIRFIFHNPADAHRSADRLPGRLAGGRQPPRGPAIRPRAGGRGGDLVRGIPLAAPGDLAAERGRTVGRLTATVP